MTKQEFSALRTGDIVYPNTGVLKDCAFEILETGYGDTWATLMEDFTVTTYPDIGVECVTTYKEGYLRKVVWSNFRVKKHWYD